MFTSMFSSRWRTVQKWSTHLGDRHMGNHEIPGHTRSGVCPGIRPEVGTLAGDVSICSDMEGTDWCSGNIPWSSDRLSPPRPASPPWSANLAWWIISVRSGDRQGQVLDTMPGGQVGQVELGDFAAASVRGSVGLAYRQLLRKVIGCWGKTGGDISAWGKLSQTVIVQSGVIGALVRAILSDRSGTVMIVNCICAVWE